MRGFEKTCVRTTARDGTDSIDRSSGGPVSGRSRDPDRQGPGDLEETRLGTRTETKGRFTGKTPEIIFIKRAQRVQAARTNRSGPDAVFFPAEKESG